MLELWVLINYDPEIALRPSEVVEIEQVSHGSECQGE